MQTYRNLIINILNHIGSGVPDALRPGYEEVKEWPQPAFKALRKQGVIKPASPAKVVVCPGCEEACLMPVEVIPGNDVRPARIFIGCDKREDAGRIPIDENSLKNWQIDVEQLASFLSTALGADSNIEELLPNQAYYLGTLTINRKRRSAIFVGNKETLDSLFEAGLLEQYLPPFLLRVGN